MPKSPLSTVRVLGKTYKVKLGVHLEEHVGDHSQLELTIRVRGGMPADEERETLLHELCHAVDEQLGLRISEKHIRAFSVGLYAMLRDNPALVKYLTKASRK